MGRCYRYHRQFGGLIKGCALLLGVLSLAVVGIVHFAEAMAPSGILAVGAIAVAGVLLFAWTRERFQTSTKVAVTLFMFSAIAAARFALVQPTYEWTASDVRITGILNEGNRVHIAGLVFGGLFPESISMELSPGVRPPGLNQDFRIYRSPNNPARISTSPVVNETAQVSREYLAAAAIALLAGAACSFRSIRNRDRPKDSRRWTSFYLPLYSG